MKAPFFHGALARLGLFPFFLRVSCLLVFSLLPLLSSFVFFFSPTPPPLFIHLPPHSISQPSHSRSAFPARAVYSFLRERASGGWLGDSPTPASPPPGALPTTPGAIRPACAPRAIRRWRNRCFARRKRGAARRGGRASVPPPGRPMRGFDKRASRAMIRPSLLRCLRKAQAFGRRWG